MHISILKYIIYNFSKFLSRDLIMTSAGGKNDVILVDQEI